MTQSLHGLARGLTRCVDRPILRRCDKRLDLRKVFLDPSHIGKAPIGRFQTFRHTADLGFELDERTGIGARMLTQLQPLGELADLQFQPFGV
ncbi:MAG: hypothetical protein KDJ16_13805, partial [Hyphomicrobiales bacterium]|nr:hypothetical protein [Hyphomicrobiales bacterium]